MPKETLIDLLDKMAPEVKKAFLKAIRELNEDFEPKAFKAAWDRGDIDGALKAIGVSAEYFLSLRLSLQAAFNAAGQQLFEQSRALARRSGIEALGRFDLYNERAEQVLSKHSSEKVVEIVEGQKRALRNSLERNMREGVNAGRAKLDIIGRSPAPGQPRVGGILGLTDAQEAYVDNFKKELRSGKASEMKNYLNRKRRDKRFDKVIERAIASGKPVSEKDITKITERYADRLLQLRAETISRTELLSSMHAAQDEGLEQMIESGKVRRDAITVKWDASEDKDTRSSHRAMDGQTRKKGEAFRTGNGYLMRRPGDSSLGAPASEIINCRCRLEVDIDFLADLGPDD